jgi:hypothetical protein
MSQRVVVLVVCVLVGCGSNRDTPVDSGATADSSIEDDAAVDAPVPPPPRIRIVWFTGLFPVADVPILIQRSDDTVVGEARTDIDGITDITLPEGGTTVSLLPTYSGGVKGVLTYLGVKPGDVLEVGSAFPEKTAVDEVTLQLPPLPEGSRSYFVDMRCRTLSALQTPTITFGPCGSPTNFLIRDENHHQFYTDRLSLTSGQVVDLTAAEFRGTRPLTARVENAGAPRFGANFSTYTSDWFLSLSQNQSRFSEIQNGTGTAEFAIADIAGAEVTTSVAIGDAGRSKIWYRREAATPFVMFDFAQNGVAFISEPFVIDNTVLWGEQGTGGDLAFAMITLQDTGSSRRVQIAIFGPKTGNALRLPTLPAPYTDRNPTSYEDPHLFRVGIARATGGWDAVRRYAQLDDFFRLDWLHGDFVISE